MAVARRLPAGGIHAEESGGRLAITLVNQTRLLEDARATLRAFLERHGVRDRPLYCAELVLEEAATNIIRYAFDDPAEHLIGIEVEVDPEGIGIAFEDEGKPFDPCRAVEPVRPSSIADAVPGGLGISLMRKMSESMRYDRIAGHNRLEVRIARG